MTARLTAPDVPVATIGLVPGHGFFMWVVRKITGAPYGHAFIYYGNGLIIEAEGNGVRWGDVSKYPGIYWCRALTRDLTDAQRAAAVAWARAHIGTPYSWVDDAEIAFDKVFHWSPPFMRKRLADTRTLMCSGLCVAALRAVGKVLFPGKPAGGVAPGDLYWLNQRTP